MWSSYRIFFFYHSLLACEHLELAWFRFVFLVTNPLSFLFFFSFFFRYEFCLTIIPWSLFFFLLRSIIRSFGIHYLLVSSQTSCIVRKTKQINKSDPCINVIMWHCYLMLGLLTSSFLNYALCIRAIISSLWIICVPLFFFAHFLGGSVYQIGAHQPICWYVSFFFFFSLWVKSAYERAWSFFILCSSNTSDICFYFLHHCIWNIFMSDSDIAGMIAPDAWIRVDLGWRLQGNRIPRDLWHSSDWSCT